jgi:hypothetical protein
MNSVSEVLGAVCTSECNYTQLKFQDTPTDFDITTMSEADGKKIGELYAV